MSDFGGRMEILSIVLLSVFAFYGLFVAIMEYLKVQPDENKDAGYRIILDIPEDAAENLEGVIRTAFSEEMPDKLMTDRKLYVSTSGNNAQINRIIRDMQAMYPIEVLPRIDRCCIITGSNLYTDG